MEKYKHYPINNVAPQCTLFLEYEADFDIQIDSVHVSSSTAIKAEVYVDGERAATLFTSSRNLQAEYALPIKIKKGQTFDIGIKNMDSFCAADAYISFKETKKSRKRK